jgi:hypothetical protein
MTLRIVSVDGKNIRSVLKGGYIRVNQDTLLAGTISAAVSAPEDPLIIQVLKGFVPPMIRHALGWE